VTRRVLLLTPSRGLGGGTERYVEALEWAFTREKVQYRRIDLGRSGASAHAQMLAETSKRLRASIEPIRLVLAHRCLLPVGLLLARERAVRGISVICHGSDVWGTQLRPRRYLEKRLMGSPRVRVVAVSSFTSGALSGGVLTTILPPGLSRDWFDTLVKASANQAPVEPGISLVTAFRLADWREKGLPELLDALAVLRRPDIRVTVCGSGEPSRELVRLVSKHERCVLRPGLTDSDLAAQLAAADIFVLATRTRQGRHPSGEGFGLVLLEAQVAGTPVIAPAYGGSHDAFIERVTGVAPADESVEALAKVLDELLRDPCELAQMGTRAGKWARESFAPELYAARAVGRLL